MSKQVLSGILSSIVNWITSILNKVFYRKQTRFIYWPKYFSKIQVYKYKIDDINYERSALKDPSDSEQNLKVVKQILTLLLLDHIS